VWIETFSIDQARVFPLSAQKALLGKIREDAGLVRKSGIEALVKIHEDNAGGATSVLYCDDNLYIMQRTGYGEDPGLIYVLNNSGDTWNGRLITTLWPNATFQPVAWWSKIDMARPINQSTDRDGRAQFYAPPRGYAVYAIK